MELSEEQINYLAQSIKIEDVKNYINTHYKEYQEFLKSRENKNLK